MSLSGINAASDLDDLALGDSPVHRLDARIQLLATVLFVVVLMTFPRYELAALAPFALYPAALVAVARVPPWRILKPLLVASPFAIFVGLLNPLVDRAPFYLADGITVDAGWISFTALLCRFALTVGAALILVACTGINRLCWAMEKLGIPRAFAVQVLFLYRYVFVIAAEASRMSLSARLRSAGGPGIPWRAGGPLLGHLLLRATDRAERIYLAMAARGFDGNIRVGSAAGISAGDWCYLAGWAAFFLVMRFHNLPRMIGELILGGGISS